MRFFEGTGYPGWLVLKGHHKSLGARTRNYISECVPSIKAKVHSQRWGGGSSMSRRNGCFALEFLQGSVSFRFPFEHHPKGGRSSNLRSFPTAYWRVLRRPEGKYRHPHQRSRAGEAGAAAARIALVQKVGTAKGGCPFEWWNPPLRQTRE